MEEDMIFTEGEAERARRQAALYGEPADMEFSVEEVHGSHYAREQGLGGADMEFSIEEVHQAEQAAGAGHGPGEHGEDHHDPLHTAHVGHIAAEIPHLVAEGMHAAHDAHRIADAARSGVTLSPTTASPLVAGAGLILGPIGAVLGGAQLGQGIRDDSAEDVVGGGLGIAAGTAVTGNSVAAMGGASLFAEAAPVLAAGAVGYGIGREADGPLGELTGGASRAALSEEEEIAGARRAQEMANSEDTGDNLVGEAAMRLEALYSGRREVTQRGMNGGTEVVERDDPVSDRIAEAAFGGRSTGAISDEEIDREYENGSFGRSIAEYLPTMLGGDITTARYFGFE